MPVFFSMRTASARPGGKVPFLIALTVCLQHDTAAANSTMDMSFFFSHDVRSCPPVFFFLDMTRNVYQCWTNVSSTTRLRQWKD